MRDGGSEAGYIVAEFDKQSTRFFTDDGDWAATELKAECPSNMFVNGISTTSDYVSPRTLAHTALCQQSELLIDHTAEHTHGTPGGSEDRADTQTGEWDPGYFKIECAASEVVTGVAQDPSLVFGTILCSPSVPGLDDSSCAAMYVYHDMDNRLPNDHGEWAYLYAKTECGSFYVLKGVSVDGTGQLHRLLCCEPMQSP